MGAATLVIEEITQQYHRWRANFRVRHRGGIKESDQKTFTRGEKMLGKEKSKSVIQEAMKRDISCGKWE